MRPARRIKQAEEAARKLKALLASSILSQLLQRTPPAALTAQQQAQLTSCCDVISQLDAAFQGASSLNLQLVDAMLRQQVACSIGSLVTWVQQQPEQQLLDLIAAAFVSHQGSAPVACAAAGTAASIWVAGVQLLGGFAAVAITQTPESAGACNIAARLTQQVDQSGETCSFNC
jgi:hypothetical protein